MSLDSALTSKGHDVPEGHYEEAQMKQTVVPIETLSSHQSSMVLPYLKQSEQTKRLS